MRSGELFAGVGGLGMAVDEVFGSTPAWFCEFDDAPSRVLAHHYPDVPNHGDVTAVEWAAVEPVNVLAGGFPCQDVSLAGRRRGLKEGTRSGLWSEFARAIDILRPDWVVIENVRGLLSADAAGDVEPCAWCVGDGTGEHALRALGAVLGDLAELGFDAEWTGIRASDVGAPHGRFRVFILAWPCDRTAPDDDGAGRGSVGRLDPERRDAHGRGRADAAGNGGEPTAHVTLLGTPRVSSGHGAGQGVVVPGTDWGPYADAVRRWEYVLGRPAPSPVRFDGKGGKARLNPELPEWMMGWPAGHVTDPAIGLSRAEQLKACGNGVVPQQAAAALRELLVRPGVPAQKEAA